MTPRCQHPRAARATPNAIAQCRACFKVVEPATCPECCGEGDLFDPRAGRWKRCLACDQGVIWREPTHDP